MSIAITERSFKVRAGKIIKNSKEINKKLSPIEYWVEVQKLVKQYFKDPETQAEFYGSKFGDELIDIAATAHKIGIKTKRKPDDVEKTIDELISTAKSTVRTKSKPRPKPAIGRKIKRSKPVVASKPVVENTFFGEKAAEDIFPPKTKITTGVDIVFSFDDTGSMAACRNITRSLIDKLSAELLVQFGDKLNVGVIIHGDYCDGPCPVVNLGLSKDWVSIKRFLNAPRNFSGGDVPECYEAVLHCAHNFDWRMHAEKILVIIGDELPHEPTYRLNTSRFDWNVEVENLAAQGVRIISVQALNHRYADKFYATMASKTNGYHLQLTQLDQITDLIRAICYKSCGMLTDFENKIDSTRSGNSPSFKRNIDILAGRTTEINKIEGLSDFQMFTIDHDVKIRDFVENIGLSFKPGCGYYEFTKSENVQDYKKVVVQDRTTEVFYPDLAGRKLLSLPSTGTVRINPKHYSKKYRFFIQSTSYTRILKAGTIFLYDNRD